MPPASRARSTRAAAPAQPIASSTATRTPRRAPRRAAPVVVEEVEPEADDDPGSEPDAEFHTEDIDTGERTYDLVIVGKRGTEYPFTTYTPKMTYWFDTGDVLQRTQRAEAAEAAQSSSGLAASTSDRRKWGKAQDEAPTAAEMRTTMLTFLDACLSDEDSAKLTALYRAKRSDVDDPQLIDAAIELYFEFEPDFTEQARQMGMGPHEVKRPASLNREQRRAAQRSPRR